MTSAAVINNQKAPFVFKQVKHDFIQLQAFHQKCLNFGLSPAQLPTIKHQQAFCLLGDYERTTVINTITPKWVELQTRNLTPTQKVENASTAMLRYLLVITDVAIEEVSNIQDRFNNVDLNSVEILGEDNGLISYTPSVAAAWATPVSYSFWISAAVSSVKIMPDIIFGLSHTLFVNQNNEPTALEFDLICDDGEVKLLIQDTSGKIYKAVIKYMVININNDDKAQSNKWDNKEGAHHVH
jgi:hypothetical protein